MRNLINIVSEDSTAGDLITPVAGNAALNASEWGKKAEPKEATPESEALAKMKEAHQAYIDILKSSKAPSAEHHLKMMRKMNEVLQWMG